MSVPKRAFVVISWVALLNGCAMAAGFQIASVAATSLSYLISGKSLSDHVISGAMGSDCALHRIIEGQAPCRTNRESLAANEDTELVGSASALAFASVEPVEVAAPITASIDIPDTGPRLFVVVGSYRELANAENHLIRKEGARITPAIINNQRHFRVVLGPFGDSISNLARSDTGLKATGGWPVWLCPDTLRAPPCVTQVAQLTP